MRKIQQYLETYYTTLNAENRNIVNFLRNVPCSGIKLLDYACGGCLLVSGVLARKFHRIDFTDTNHEPLTFIEDFQKGKCKFDWTSLFQEAEIDPIALRWRMGEYYLSRLPFKGTSSYDTITCFFCLETASTSFKEFQHYYHSLITHVNPGGWLIVGMTQGAYQSIPGANHRGITEFDEHELIFALNPSIFKSIPAQDGYGYSRMVFIASQP